MLGVIEGFFGKSWPWEERQRYARLLPQLGYSFYIYAPKEDRFLRRAWTEAWPQPQLESLQRLAESCRASGVQFGVGLSPFEAYVDFGPDTAHKLRHKVKAIDEALHPRLLCILFDDMRGDMPELAVTQIKILDVIAAATTAERLVMCPTYYSIDPVLEKVFGAMPKEYWRMLAELDQRIDIFWTGPRVCSTEYPRRHLEWVAHTLKRKPFLWDNYPVNDSRRMSPFLYLRPFEGRPAELKELLAGHAVNPMKQPRLSQIPLETLPLSYELGVQYVPNEVFHKTVERICGPELGLCFAQDLAAFHDVGLEQMSAGQKIALRQKYARFAGNPWADEVVAWIDGKYAFDPACLTD